MHRVRLIQDLETSNNRVRVRVRRQIDVIRSTLYTDASEHLSGKLRGRGTLYTDASEHLSGKLRGWDGAKVEDIMVPAVTMWPSSSWQRLLTVWECTRRVCCNSP